MPLDRAPELKILRQLSERFFARYMAIKSDLGLSDSSSSHLPLLSTNRIMLGFSDHLYQFNREKTLLSLLDLRDSLSNTVSHTSGRRSKARSSNALANMESILGEAIAFVRDGVIPDIPDVPLAVEEHDHLKKTIEIPDQKPAPVRISANNNSLSLESSPPPNGDLNTKSVVRFRRAAASQIRQAIELCEESNTDQRFIDALKGLARSAGRSEKLFSVEDLGIRTRIIRSEIPSHEGPMPELALVQTRAALTTLRTVLNEYSEWREYERIERLSDDAIDPSSLVDLADNVAETLRGQPGVDPGVVDRLGTMISQVKDGFIRSESVSVPLLYSLTNIMAHAARVALEHPTAGALIREAAWSTATGVTSNFFHVCALLVWRFGDRMMSINSLEFVGSVRHWMEQHRK